MKKKFTHYSVYLWNNPDNEPLFLYDTKIPKGFRKMNKNIVMLYMGIVSLIVCVIGIWVLVWLQR